MQVTATFTDPTGRFTAQADILIRDAIAAFNMWTPYLADSAGSVDIGFHLVSNYANRGGGSPIVAVNVGTDNGFTIGDSGVAFELRTGRDPNGATADADVYFDVDYLAAHYWINPLDGSTGPADKNDLVEVIAHELGHAMAFSGYRNVTTGQVTGTFESTFDRLVVFIDGKPYFTGAHAVALYGGPVPITVGNPYHLGNAAPGAGADLLSDLMNGVVLNLGKHYAPGPLDIAILSDVGLATILSDVLNGSAQADVMHGGAGDDVINGLAGADTLYGDDGNDTITGGAGDDIIDGGAGADVAVFAGAIASYTTTRNADGSWTVKDNRAGSPDGTDTVVNVETLRFADASMSVAVPLSAAVAAAFTAVLRADPTSGAGLALATSMAALSTSAAMTAIVQAAASTTSVATLAYEFFTGKAPTAGGMDYLVSPTGPNSNNLNSPYYQSFNLENRYINFAVNLGKSGDGAASFSAGYGALSFYDAFKKAYGVIFGDVTDAKVHAILDPTIVLGGVIMTRQQYFATYGGDGVTGIGTKAAAVGWLMSEAEKADIGTYAKSNDAFLLDVAQNNAPFAVDLIGKYAKPEYVFHPG